MITLLFWFFIMFILSAFFSAAEMAFVSSNRVKMREKADSGSRSAARIMNLYKDPHHFLTTILIGNNIANVTGTAILTYFFSEYYAIRSEWLITAIMTPLLLVFAEVIPKDYSRIYPRRFLLLASPVLSFVFKGLYVITDGVLKGVDFFLKPLGGGDGKSIFVSEQEFRSMIEESTETGVVSQHEKKLIDTILDFEKRKVKEVMTPVGASPKVEIHATVEDVKKIARETGAKMLLVYEEIPSIVVGMIYVFDLLFEESETLGLRKFLRAPVFVRDDTSNEMAFFTLQQRRQSYAVVVDAEQEVVGVVPIEGLLVF